VPPDVVVEVEGGGGAEGGHVLAGEGERDLGWGVEVGVDHCLELDGDVVEFCFGLAWDEELGAGVSVEGYWGGVVR